MSVIPCYGKGAIRSREHSNGALLLDLTRPSMKKLNTLVSDPSATIEEENTCKQVIRKLKVYLINANWPGVENGKGIKVDNNARGDDINRLLEDIIGGDSNTKAGRVLHFNCSNEPSTARREVSFSTDHSGPIDAKKIAPQNFENCLDIPFSSGPPYQQEERQNEF